MNHAMAEIIPKSAAEKPKIFDLLPEYEEAKSENAIALSVMPDQGCPGGHVPLRIALV